jgi:hypothetical protein
MEIAQFETLHLILDLTGGSVQKPINIPFECDEIILKYVSFINVIPDGAVFNVLHSNLINNDVLFVFPKTDVFLENLNTPFHCNPHIQGEYNFRITDTNGEQIIFTSFDICLVLVFIRYKKSLTYK